MFAAERLMRRQHTTPVMLFRLICSRAELPPSAVGRGRCPRLSEQPRRLTPSTPPAASHTPALSAQSADLRYGFAAETVRRSDADERPQHANLYAQTQPPFALKNQECVKRVQNMVTLLSLSAYAR